MNLQILPASTFKTNAWAGGTTTELFIYPPTANYAERNFDFRISTATVDIEFSEFTALPGFARKLMVLAGETTLTHENHHRKKLQKLDVDSFLGDWRTTSAGKCIDFNVMTSGNLISTLSAQEIPKGAVTSYQLQENCNWLFIYVFEGEICFEYENNLAKKGDIIIFENPQKSPINLTSLTKCTLVFTEISAS